ncbi:unnamed protein product [Calypogeia fissa]
MAGKTLSENGVKNFVILEASEKIGGRIRSDEFAGLTVELGANWVEGVNGEKINPIWPLAMEVNLRTFLSDTSNISSNIYDISGALPKQTKAQAETTAETGYVTSLSTSLSKNGEEDISVLTAQRLYGCVPSSPVEMVLDYKFYDGEFAEPPRVTSLINTQPVPTFKTFGADSYFVADRRGYSIIIQPLASYLKSKNGTLTDTRLKLNKVVNKIEYSEDGVTVSTEDGSKYCAKAAILTVSLGVLQSKLITFKPELPYWKAQVISEFDMAIYTKVFLKFPKSFWRTGHGTEFFLYADGSRGYYPIWQHMDNHYPDSYIIFVTVTDDESRRIEQQSDEQTLTEVMEVLRKMFGPDIPDPEDVLIPRWWSNRFFRGSFSNWPIGVTHNKFKALQAPISNIFFAGEHTSMHYNGYVHGAYYSGIDSAIAVIKSLQKNKCPSTQTEESKNVGHIKRNHLESTCAAPVEEVPTTLCVFRLLQEPNSPSAALYIGVSGSFGSFLTAWNDVFNLKFNAIES